MAARRGLSGSGEEVLNAARRQVHFFIVADLTVLPRSIDLEPDAVAEVNAGEFFDLGAREEGALHLEELFVDGDLEHLRAGDGSALVLILLLLSGHGGLQEEEYLAVPSLTTTRTKQQPKNITRTL